ncbi:hypothetical protein BD769DRAFT_1453591 [Suillus cothurnatus]|nr:hypothetical protein BD769DRAFT_1453591 [Suillus cothurnatus]
MCSFFWILLIFVEIHAVNHLIAGSIKNPNVIIVSVFYRLRLLNHFPNQSNGDFIADQVRALRWVESSLANSVATDYKLSKRRR